MKRIWIAVGMAAVVTLIYFPALKNHFVYDDTICIEMNRELDRPISQWLFNSHYFLASREFSYRPLITLTHIFDRKYGPLFGHVVNMGLHWMVGWSLFSLACRFISMRASAVAAFLFLVHPAYSEVVYLITFREDILCSLFLLCALHMGLKGNAYGCVAMSGLALFSKESALLFPFFILLLFRRSEFAVLKRALPGLLTLDVIYAAIRFIFLKHYYMLHGGPHEWLPVESAVLTGFLRLLTFPLTLSADHAIPANPGFWLVWPGMFAAAVTVYYTARLWVKNHIGFVPLIWLTLFLLPTLNILPLPNISAERYLYLPLLLPACAAGYWLDRKLGLLRFYPKLLKGVLALVCLWMVLLGIRTHLRGYDFKDNETFYRAELGVNPYSRTMAWALGQMYFFQHRFDESRKYIEQALSIEPDYYPALLDLGRLEMQMGNKHLAEQYFKQAIDIAPTDPLPWLMLAAYKTDIGDTEGAKPLYRRAIRLPPTPALQSQELLDTLRYYRYIDALEARDTSTSQLRYK